MIKSNYKKLLAFFGPQGWWPTTPAHGKTPQYKPKKSLKHNSGSEAFEICLGAILTQNTNWENVVKALSSLKKENQLTAKKIRSLSVKKLETLIKSSGYFRQKARRVKNFIEIIFQSNGPTFHSFLKGPTSKIRRRLLEIKGIGPETADSMLLYAGGHPIFVVDAYTRRIGSRWGVFSQKASYDEIQKIFMRQLPKSTSLFGEYHALLVELAKKFCKTKPACENCPVQKTCVTGRNS